MLRVPGAGASGTADGCECGAPRELLLRSKSIEKVGELERRLCMASLEAGRQPLAQRSGLSEAGRRLLGQPLPRQSRPASSSELGGLQEGLQTCGPDPRSLSFGSPVTAVDSEADVDSLKQLPAGVEAGPSSSPKAHDSSSSGSDSDLSGSSAGAGRPRSAPGSPVLPGLPLVSVGRRQSASAPVSPAHALRTTTQGGRLASIPEHHQRQEHLDAALLGESPVRLMSFSGRHIGGVARQAQQQQQQQQTQQTQGQMQGQQQQHVSNIQRLEQAVAQLSSELAQARVGGSSSGAARPVLPAPAACDPHAVQDGSATAEAGQAQANAQGTADPRQQLCKAHTVSSEGGDRLQDTSSSGAGTRHLELLLHENSLLLQQQAALQAQLGRMQGQLSAAAADNIRLAQEAAGAVRQLQAASASLAGSQQQEAQLRASLAGAVGQCEAVGRELAGLSSKLEARTAQCQELR